MPISYNHKFKFIHIPKTGGTSIEDLFDLMNKNNLYEEGRSLTINNVNFSLQHLPHSLINKMKPESVGWTSFTIVRNPYTRILSEYVWNHKFKTGRDIKSFNECDFNKWIDDDLIKYDTDHKMPQNFFIDIPVDITLRFEELNDDFNKINNKLKTSYNLKFRNKSSFNKETILRSLTPKTKDKIYKLYEDDFKIFNYLKI